MAKANTNAEMFKIKNMRNLNWTNRDGSPSISKASFTLVFLPHGAEVPDCLYKVGKNGPWVEAKSFQCDEWTDRNGNKHTWQQCMRLKPMGKLLDQLEQFVTSIYNETGDYSAINATPDVSAPTETAPANTAAVVA